MEYTTVYSMLSLAFSLGLIHALDADHIMAVTAFSSHRSRQKSGSVIHVLWFCIRWALGHGTILIALSVLFLFSRFQLPEWMIVMAEKMIGCLLIGIGIWIIYNIFRNKLALEVHSHKVDDNRDVVHVHLNIPGKTQHDHQPVLIGMTHGLAGSAPVLALIPATGQTSLLYGVGYVGVFCLGVLLSMMIFGIFFGRLQNWFAGFGQRLFKISRLAIASISIGFGTYWLIP